MAHGLHARNSLPKRRGVNNDDRITMFSMKVTAYHTIMADL